MGGLDGTAEPIGAHAADDRIDGDKLSAAAGSAAHKIVSAIDGTSCSLVMAEQKSNPRALAVKTTSARFLEISPPTSFHDRASHHNFDGSSGSAQSCNRSTNV